jgi:hypothetical protein
MDTKGTGGNSWSCITPNGINKIGIVARNYFPNSGVGVFSSKGILEFLCEGCGMNKGINTDT